MAFTVGVVLFAVGIGLSIALHEFGHLLTAKAFGMKATQYFIGFGPTLFSVRRGETEYGLKAIPAGGYVKIIGMTPLEGDEEMHGVGSRRRTRPPSPFPPPGAPTAPPPAGADAATTAAAGVRTPAAGVASPGGDAGGPSDAWVRVGGVRVRATGGPRAFWRFPTWKRVVVLSAGSVTHLLIAIVAIYGAAVVSGLPTERAVVGQVQPCVVIRPEANGAVRDCRAGDPLAPAATAGLRAGDRIVRVGDTDIRTFTDLLTTLRANPGRTVPVTVVRDGRQQTVTMTIAQVQRRKLPTEPGSATELHDVGAIGVAPAAIEKFGPVAAIGATAGFTGTIVAGTFGALVRFPGKVPQLLSSLGGGPRDPNGPVSVVGVSRVGGQALEAGSALVFVLLFAGFNIFVGVFNLFPLLPLDGGHVAVLLFEKVRSRLARALGRADPGRVDYAKLMPLTIFVIAVFGGISLLAILADIVNPINNPFQ